MTQVVSIPWSGQRRTTWGCWSRPISRARGREGLERGLTSLNPTYYYRYEIAAHLAAESYNEAELEEAAQEVLSVARAGDHGALDDVAYVLRGLEALGREDLIDELLDSALALLEWYWVAPRSLVVPSSRGFSSNPEKYPSFDEDTLRGLQLMAASVSQEWTSAGSRTTCADRRARSRSIRSSCRTST